MYALGKIRSLKMHLHRVEVSEEKVANIHEWLLTSLAQNRLTIYQQFCLSEIKQPLSTFHRLWMTSDFGCFAFGVNEP